MANYLTIQQASEATGKSARTIRRLCYDDRSKDFVTHDEKKRLLVDANYLAQHYALKVTPQPDKIARNDNGKSMDIAKNMTIDNDRLQKTENLTHKIALLELELKYKEELFHKITLEKERQMLDKDKRIEDLNRALLLLGEGRKKESEQQVPILQPAISEQALVEKPEQPKKKRWWQW